MFELLAQSLTRCQIDSQMIIDFRLNPMSGQDSKKPLAQNEYFTWAHSICRNNARLTYCIPN